MEKPLERHLDELLNSYGVTGAMCADTGGFCIGAKGNAPQQSAGMISSLTQQAAKLHPEENQMPVIVIESDAGNLIVKQHQDIAVAISKVT